MYYFEPTLTRRAAVQEGFNCDVLRHRRQTITRDEALHESLYQRLWTREEAGEVFEDTLVYSVQNLSEKASAFLEADASIQPVVRHSCRCRA